MKKYIGDNVILRYNKQSEFEQIPLGSLVDIVGDCNTREGMDILASWERHFKGVGTPFAVTRDPGGTHKIWKLNEVGR